MNLTTLLQQRGDLWRGGETPSSVSPAVATGFDALDRQLAGNGWPLGAITEIMTDGGWGDALALLAPALALLSRESRWIVMVAPPHIPYAPGLAARGIDLSSLLLLYPQGEQERLWALEQSLRAGSCAAVLAWPEQLSAPGLRRLQLASEAGNSSGFLFRPERAGDEPSSAALRLRLSGRGELDILKRRGGWPVRGIRWEK